MSILDTNEHSDIISWLPHGRGFIIRDKRRLADEVLPKYFKESKYTSFTRRLNRWNFTIQTHGHKEASYFHPMFIRGDPQRSLEMHPTPQSSNKARESRYIDENQAAPSDAVASASSSATKSGSNVASMASMSTFEAGNSGMYPDVSAQVMAAGAAAAGAVVVGSEAYMGPRSNNSMPALPQSQMAPNGSAANQALPQAQTVAMQPPYYAAMNPMYGTQAHQRSNYTRDMMYPRLSMDRSGIPREYQAQNGMVLLHPQLGTHQQHAAAVMHPHQMPYGEFHQQYIPTTAASHAHMQARFGRDPQIQNLRPSHSQMQLPNIPFGQFPIGNASTISGQPQSQKSNDEGSGPSIGKKTEDKAQESVDAQGDDDDSKTGVSPKGDSKIINDVEPGSEGGEVESNAAGASSPNENDSKVEEGAEAEDVKKKNEDASKADGGAEAEDAMKKNEDASKADGGDEAEDVKKKNKDASKAEGSVKVEDKQKKIDDASREPDTHKEKVEVKDSDASMVDDSKGTESKKSKNLSKASEISEEADSSRQGESGKKHLSQGNDTDSSEPSSKRAKTK